MTACSAALVATTLAPVQAAPADTGSSTAITETADVVEVVLANAAELDRLVATGTDLDHGVEANEDGSLAVRAVITPSERSELQAAGFTLADTLYTETDTEAALAERDATIAANVEANRSFAAAVAASASVSDVRITRADYYTSYGVGYLSVEAKWAGGQGATTAMVVQRDSGPGTALGSGGTQNITRFVDSGVYLYHRGASQVAQRPDTIKVTSPTGDTATATVTDWLPTDKDDAYGPHYQTDFINSYMTPTDLYARIHDLAGEFPQISEIVELPYKTNGYRRKAQAVLGTANASRVAIDSKAWGHEGGNDITVSMVNPGPNSALSVSVTGSAISVSLATDGSGAATSTAAEVVSALNGSTAASGLVIAYTYRGSVGNGAVAAAPVASLTDGLSAPASVSRDPQPVYALRIGKTRNGSKTGVLAYAQEHAREWVPPLVSVEAAERLLRNYAHDATTRTLVNDLDIWIVPSVNPDGGHYSFYDYASQRKNMTNHCPLTGNADFAGRNTWGVDVNRNYDTYSLFDGFSGASTSCTSGTYAGPGELTEPESSNIDWVAAKNKNIKFSMNLHSSGNYFMWSPGAYTTPDRVSTPRPTLEQEGFFWGASSRILSEIKRYRGLSVTPARTGPIIDVLYSAAGNSGDMLWYKHGIYAWNFEVGGTFQPPFTNENPNGLSGHAESQEFANGLVELMRVARDFGMDRQNPRSSAVVSKSSEPGMVDVTFEINEPAAVFYTVDGARPTYESNLVAAAGIREPAAPVTVPVGTTVQWFSVDSAGNVEKNYRPDGRGNAFSKLTVKAPK